MNVCAAQQGDISEFAVGRDSTANPCNSAHLRVHRSHVRCIERIRHGLTGVCSRDDVVHRYWIVLHDASSVFEVLETRLLPKQECRQELKH